MLPTVLKKPMDQSMCAPLFLHPCTIIGNIEDTCDTDGVVGRWGGGGGGAEGTTTTLQP